MCKVIRRYGLYSLGGWNDITNMARFYTKFAVKFLLWRPGNTELRNDKCLGTLKPSIELWEEFIMRLLLAPNAFHLDRRKGGGATHSIIFYFWERRLVATDFGFLNIFRNTSGVLGPSKKINGSFYTSNISYFQRLVYKIPWLRTRS